MPRYVVEFTVSGQGTFPTDMLRYEHCWPAREEDSINMICDFRAEDRKEVRTVQLRMHTERKGVLPTVDRWKSFQWSVHKDIHERRL